MQPEKNYDLLLQILKAINISEQSEDSIPKILSLIKKSTGFEAVAIRLKSGLDYPYYITDGFPEYFVIAENFLCSYDNSGELLKDEKGNPLLECMCGNIIRKRFDPTLPFFTKGGSFWSNCTSDLLASTTENDRQGRTRNRCNSEGYESVALIPLRLRNENIGLIQFNDKRKNMFTEEFITDFEKIAEAIGIAYSQKVINGKLESNSILLNDRIRQLNFLNNITSIIEGNDTIDEILENFIEKIPMLWEKSSNFNANLSIFNKKYSTVYSFEGNACLELPIVLNKDKIGSLAISNIDPLASTNNKYNGEKAVLNIAVNRIEKTIELILSQEELKKNNELLEQRVDGRTEELRRLTVDLKKLVNEKQVLLQEVYHRTKNNLSVISSLLSLQIDRIKDNKSKQYLLESKNRILSMLRLHELLSRSSNFVEVNIGIFIPDLAKSIILNYEVASPKIRLELDIPEITLHINIATPFALIINEILTNSLKYAFPGNRNGCISISVKESSKKNIVLTISDDGIGLGDEADISKMDSLGMSLIFSLVGQIDGRLKVSSSSGVEYIIEFPRK